MNTNFSLIKTNLVEHEGFYYVEYNGEFFKGCRRCGGTGHFSFDGFDSLCYLCRNDPNLRLGDHFETEADAQKWCHGKAVRQATVTRKREEARLAALAKRQAAWDKLAELHPAVWDLVSKAADVASFAEQRESEITERDRFVLNLANMLWDYDTKTYSPAQIAALQKIADKRNTQTEEAAQHPVVAGRQVITGEIVGTKMVEGDYGVAYKITVKDDRGFRIYCTIPSAQLSELDDSFDKAKGRRITFTATVEASRDDASFGFGSRPTKGAWI